jgi:hypothetical protein
MRNNRRLIQNARQCVSDIRSGKVFHTIEIENYYFNTELTNSVIFQRIIVIFLADFVTSILLLL